MPRDYDRLFAQTALHNKLITDAILEACMEKLRQMEIEEEPGTFASVAVEEGHITREKAERIIQLINGKFPGKHPPLAGQSAAKQAARAAKYASPAGKPAPRPIPSRPRLGADAARPRRKRNGIILATGGGAAAVVLAIVLAFSLKGKPRPRPAADEAAVPKAIEPIKNKPEPPSSRRLPDPDPKPAPKPVPDPAPKPESLPRDADAEFRARLEHKRSKARERVAEIRKEMEEEKKEAEQAARALRERLSRRPVSIALRGGETYERALIRSAGFSDLEFDAGGRTVSLPWEALTTESILSAADALYDPTAADRQFERGRFLVTRRLWKEALEAFQRAAKLDESLQSKVDTVKELLERLISGHGFFRGATRRVGTDGLLLVYDWKNEAQAADFSRGLSIEKESAVLRSDKRAGVVLRRVEFLDEIDVDLRATAAGKLVIHLFAREQGYEMEIGPEGAVFYRVEAGPAPPAVKRSELARNPKGKIQRGRPATIRVTAADRVFKLFIDGAEVISHADESSGDEPPPLKGRLGFSTEGGSLAIAAPLTIRGRLDPRDAEKQFSEVEVLTRRAYDPDLQDIEDRRMQDLADDILGKRGLSLTADDPMFVLRLSSKDLAEYDRIKRSAARELPPARKAVELKAPLDRLISSYPDVPSLYYLRALYHWGLLDVEPALEDVRKALELFPEFAEAMDLEARCRDWLGDREAAMKLCRRAIEAMPDYAPAYVTRAVQTYLRDRNAPGEPWADDLRLAVKLQPSNREAATALRVLRYASRGPRDLGCRFAVESDHYSVITDISPQAADLYAARLEAAHKYFSETFKDLLPDRSAPRPRVAVFNTAENFFTYTELLGEKRVEHVLGSFRSNLNELVLFEHTDIDATLRTLYHEQFHHFTTLIVKRPLPYWFNEGLAEYMAGIAVRDGKVVQRALLHKDRLRLIQAGLSRRFAIPFERIMCEAPREFYSGPVAFKYAQAWSMVHFFYEYENGRHRSLIEKYFAELRSGASARRAFETVFKEKAADLQKEWVKYVKNLKP